MEYEFTDCWHTLIEEKRDGYIRYINRNGRRWEIIGHCTKCGKCWEGMPYREVKLDNPATPEMKPPYPICPLQRIVLEPGDTSDLPDDDRIPEWYYANKKALGHGD
jgi:hypothetical protein